jgi:hypothetical protein
MSLKGDRGNTTVVINPDDPDELIQRQPIGSFLRFEAELDNLGRADHHTLEKAAATEARIIEVEVRIKAICDLANYPDSERFIRLLRNRWRSSAARGEYDIKRNHLLLQIRKAFPAAEEHRRQRSTSNRDREMAEEFLQKKNLPSNKYISDSALKADIGKRQHGLARSASIEAINRGLKSLVP